ncbi:MAG: cobalamin-binding protein [Gammaproteobacteria bacterium]|nr:cobalamin-binding protein [Gammaproteobacteria bacterium]
MNADTTNILDSIYETVVAGDQNTVLTLVKQALATDLTPQEILDDGMIQAMAEVGDLFESGEFFVPEMLLAARAMKNGMNYLKPYLVDEASKNKGRLALGSARGDLHDIGKNLVSILMESAGFEVIDLGVDVPPDAFVEVVRDEAIEIIGMSCLLTTTMPAMKEVINQLHQADLREGVTVMVGGAPVTQDFADHIGADHFAPDANQAVKLVKSLFDKT